MDPKTPDRPHPQENLIDTLVMNLQAVAQDDSEGSEDLAKALTYTAALIEDIVANEDFPREKIVQLNIEIEKIILTSPDDYSYAMLDDAIHIFTATLEHFQTMVMGLISDVLNKGNLNVLVLVGKWICSRYDELPWFLNMALLHVVHEVITIFREEKILIVPEELGPEIVAHGVTKGSLYWADRMLSMDQNVSVTVD